MNGEKKTKKHKSKENLIENHTAEESTEEKSKNSIELQPSKGTVIVANPLRVNGQNVNNVNVNNDSSSESS